MPFARSAKAWETNLGALSHRNTDAESAPGDYALKLVHEPVGGDRALHHPAHTMSGTSARIGSTVEAPTRLRRRRTITRKPSSRQRRWIFLTFTAQPSPTASAWALR